MGSYITDAAARRLGDKQICDRCGSTLNTYGDKCTAGRSEQCPGYETIEAAIAATAKKRA